MIKRLFSYAGEYKKYVFLAPLFVILETAGELALPLLIAKIIDDGIMVGNLPMIYRIGVYMVIMAIAAVFLAPSAPSSAPTAPSALAPTCARRSSATSAGSPSRTSTISPPPLW